jgi:hypothetical protein
MSILLSQIAFAIPASMESSLLCTIWLNNINNANLGKEDYTIFTGRKVRQFLVLG